LPSAKHAIANFGLYTSFPYVAHRALCYVVYTSAISVGI